MALEKQWKGGCGTREVKESEEKEKGPLVM